MEAFEASSIREEDSDVLLQMQYNDAMTSIHDSRSPSPPLWDGPHSLLPLWAASQKTFTVRNIGAYGLSSMRHQSGPS